MLRRAAIILVTALIVVRPLVLGENPGLDSDPLDTSNLLLTMLWLVAAAVWGLWRLWARQGVWYGGAVEACLFGVILLTCAGAVFVAPYKHPARLIAWDWLALGLAVVLLRQLAVTKEEQRCFFAVLLAGVVPLSAFALYQRGYEIPKKQARYAKSLDLLREDYAKEHGGQVPDDAFLAALKQRIDDSHAYGTYAHPNNFAGYLVLLVPGLAGAALLCARHRHPKWQVMLAACFATLGVVAVVFTHSRGALLGLLVAGVGAAAVLWRGWLRQRWYYAAGVAAVLVLAGVGVWQTNLWTAGLGKSQGTAAVRLEYWRNTWSMISQHPWFGVGPGQFGRFYTRYMHETDGETIKDPHNFALEIWATSGVFALLALLGALAVFYRKVLRAVLAAPTVDGPGDLPPPPPGPREPLPVRWEFYVGGMAGLLLAFVLRVGDKSQDGIVVEAVTSGVLSVFWFAAFGLFEQVEWSDRARALALATGVTATLVNLLVSGGINALSVAQPLWCAVALALSAADPAPNAWVGRFKPLVYAPLPAVAALAVLYLVTEFYPVTDSASAMRLATAQRLSWQEETRTRPLLGGAVRTVLSSQVTEPLEKTQRDVDPDNAQVPLYLANFYAVLWETSVRQDSRHGMASTKSRTDMAEANSYIRKALYHADKVQKLDPEGREGYLAEYGLRRLFAQGWDMPNALPTALGTGGRFWQMTVNQAHPNYEKFMAEQKEQYRLAAEALKKAVDRDPNNASFRYQLADTLYRAGKDIEARENAARALELDDRNKWPTRKLANEQREQIERWLEAPTGR